MRNVIDKASALAEAVSLMLQEREVVLGERAYAHDPSEYLKTTRFSRVVVDPWALEAREEAEKLGWRRPRSKPDQSSVLRQAMLRMREHLGLCAQEYTGTGTKPLVYRGHVIVSVRSQKAGATLVTLEGRRLRCPSHEASRIAGLAEGLDFRQPMLLSKEDREGFQFLIGLLTQAWEDGLLEDVPPVIRQHGALVVTSGAWLDEEASREVRQMRARAREMWTARRSSERRALATERDMSLIFGQDDHAREVGFAEAGAPEGTWDRFTRTFNGRRWVIRVGWIQQGEHLHACVRAPGRCVGIGHRQFPLDASTPGTLGYKALGHAMRELTKALKARFWRDVPIRWVPETEPLVDPVLDLIKEWGSTRVPERLRGPIRELPVHPEVRRQEWHSFERAQAHAS